MTAVRKYVQSSRPLALASRAETRVEVDDDSRAAAEVVVLERLAALPQEELSCPPGVHQTTAGPSSAARTALTPHTPRPLITATKMPAPRASLSLH